MALQAEGLVQLLGGGAKRHRLARVACGIGGQAEVLSIRSLPKPPL